MKTILTILLLFIAFLSSSYSQEINVWQKGVKLPTKFSTLEVDSIRITPCDTSLYDLDGCDLDIDTVIVNVACGNLVSVQTNFDGTPSFIKYTIYDTTGTVIFTAYNSSQITFTLPGTGVFYGLVEANCGGGDKPGGDDDEESFEIINTAPTADFSLSYAFAMATGYVQKNISTTDNSQETGLLTYSWKVTDLASGTFSTYNIMEPNYSLIANKKY
ncbi:MAG: hypothetical protein WCT77_08415, partial [Bacteroidota bacterium]